MKLKQLWNFAIVFLACAALAVQAGGPLNLTLFTSSLPGYVPASGGGTTNFLNAAGGWTAPAGSGATTNQNIRTIGTHFDGAGSALSGTVTACARVPFAGTITGWYIDTDVSGSGNVAVHSVAFASYTGVSGFGGYADVTGGGTAPSISSATNATFANLTSWVTTVSAGTEFCFQLSSPATVTWLNVYLQVAAT